MWPLVVLGIYAISLFIGLGRLREFKHGILYFTFIALWGRLLLNYFPIAFKPVAAGISPIALYSAGVLACGLLILTSRYLHVFFLKHLIPFYLLLFSIIISSLLNNMLVPLIFEISRWGFFLVIALLTYVCIKDLGKRNVVNVYLIIFVVPLLLQLVSVPLDLRSLDNEGMLVYLGGFQGGSAFWQMLFALICLCALACGRRDHLLFSVALLCVVGLYLTGKRIAVMGTLPIFLMFAYTMGFRYMDISLKMLITFISVIVLSLVIINIEYLLPQRYMAVLDLASHVTSVIEDPRLLTEEERSAGTGRVGIWTILLFEWQQGTWVNKIFGFGPEAYGGNQPHNAYIAMLYQYGLVGLFLFLLVLVWQVVSALRSKDAVRGLRALGCIGGYATIALAGNATWALGALMALAFISAVNWAALEEREAEPVARPLAPPRRTLGARWATNTPGRVGRREGADGAGAG